MKRALLTVTLLLGTAGALVAQNAGPINPQPTGPVTVPSNPQIQLLVDANPAINEPDKTNWQLFVQVNTPAATAGNNNAVFETWASDEDTFNPNPVFPTAISPKKLKVPALVRGAMRKPGLQPHVLPGGSEEVRRNKPAFDFIVNNKLYLISGVKAAFAAKKPISFPTDSIEVKANWIPVTPNLDKSLYHGNTASDGKQYALVSMHIISKLVPNWTWATFEHKDNAGRCDYIGCRDSFGAPVKVVAAKTPTGGQYPACAKTSALKAMFTAAGLPPEYENYCLKGSQVDFVTSTGLVTLLGNSVTENGFVPTSSCMTCHSRAAVDSNGSDAFGAGFIGPSISPNGAPLASWFWNNPGKPTQSQKNLQMDFVWAIPFNAQ